MKALKSLKDIDTDLLDELISHCETTMASPFKKAKPEAAAIVIEKTEEGDEEDLHEEVAVEESADESSEGDDMDLEELLELYKKIKG